MITREGSHTKVEGVAAWIRAQIEEKRYADGRLPSEPKLSQLLSVSRGTIRQAIEQLVHEGLLVRRHGVGTFVNEQVLGIHTRLEEVWDFCEMIRASGHAATVRHQWLQLGDPDPESAQALQLSPDDEVLATANVFLADDVPVIYCIDIIPAGLVKHAYHQHELHGPVYTFLEQRCGQRVDYNITEVLPVTADAQLSHLLQCEMNAPLHLFIETGFNSEDTPIIHSFEYYRPEYFSFKVVRKMVPLRT
jgi:GntR family transcriptional regulator